MGCKDQELLLADQVGACVGPIRRLLSGFRRRTCDILLLKEDKQASYLVKGHLPSHRHIQ